MREATCSVTGQGSPSKTGIRHLATVFLFARSRLSLSLSSELPVFWASSGLGVWEGKRFRGRGSGIRRLRGAEGEGEGKKRLRLRPFFCLGVARPLL